MFAKFFQKNSPHQPPQPPSPTPPQQQQPPLPAPLQDDLSKENLGAKEINPRVDVHYGIPSTASVLAYDVVQSLLAIGTLDGRIKVIGGHNVEGLLFAPNQLPFKYLEFLQSQGFLVSVSSENEIQVWDIDQKRIASALQWESCITAFSVIGGSSYMYVGDEYGMVCVLKYDRDQVKLLQLPYYVSGDTIAASGLSSPNSCSVVGVLSQPSSRGNRMLIAYEDGLIILWDVSEDKVILVRGNKDLHLKGTLEANSDKDMALGLSDDSLEFEEEQKEISSLCWISNDGSVLAVGYVDGDILLWDLSTNASVREHQSEKSLNEVIKLQLSSASRRLPVIVLNWSTNGFHNECRGQLFVYGGDAIGSEEVLTIVTLDWSSGINHLKCNGRVDLTLNGSFADMVLLPTVGMMESSGTMVLTNPGQLHFYDNSYLSSLGSQQEGKNSLSSIQYPMVIPTSEPNIKVGKLCLIQKHETFSRVLSEEASAPRSVDWPLTGGVPPHFFAAETYQVERVYMAGYHDGSVRIWDATYPTFMLIYVLEPEVKGINIEGVSASVSALEFCPFNSTVAIGNELGMVRLYNLMLGLAEPSLKVVTATETEVHSSIKRDGPQCTTVFSLLSSPICTLQSASTRLAVGFRCGKVALLDISKPSVLFLVSVSSSQVISMASKLFSNAMILPDNTDDTDSQKKENYMKSEVFVITKDAHFAVIDSNTGTLKFSQAIKNQRKGEVIFIDIIEDANIITEGANEKHSSICSQKSEAEDHNSQGIASAESNPPSIENKASAKVNYFKECVDSFILLLCCEEALYLYSLKSLNEVDYAPIREVNLSKPCCWTTTFRKSDKEYGLILLYQTGDIEIRSFPDLQVVGESSLMSILRWNFKTNMEKTLCSSDDAQLVLVNGCEFASIALLTSGNNFRIPESLPCFYNKAGRVVVDPAVQKSPIQKTTQTATSGILGGMLKGFPVGKMEHNLRFPEVSEIDFAHLESLFSSPPFLKRSTTLSASDDEKIVELNIDDIDIDEPLYVSFPSGNSTNDSKDKGTERERLFEGTTTDSKPRMRTAEEIKAKYRKQDASSAAAQARDKLAERGERLERLSLRTQELQNGAENFASMAHELAKQMEKRKWWNI